MVEFKLKHTLLRLDFSFFAVLALYLLLDDSGFGMAALAACAMHETGHLAAMAAFGVRVEELTFYGAGIRIASSGIELEAPARKALIFAAGVLVNFAAAAAFAIAGKPAPCAVNLFTGTFNLLPMGCLDGARLLRMAAIKHCRAERVDRVMRTAAVLSGVLCAAAVFAAGGGVPFTLMTTAAYIMMLSGMP